MNAFTGILEQSTEYQRIVKNIKHKILPMGVLGLAPAPKAHLISSLCNTVGKNALVVMPDEASAHRLANDICNFGLNALVYPARDFVFRNSETKSRDFEYKRLSVLGAVLDGKCDVCVCSAEAAAQFTIPKNELKKLSVTLVNGADAELNSVVNALTAAEYVRVETVDGAGQFAVRGGIIDFFPPDCDSPVRAEFWGDSIDSLAHFDIISQRRGDSIDSIKITPACEVVCLSDNEMLQILETLSSTVQGKGSVNAKKSIAKDIELISSGIKLSSIDKYISLVYDKTATVFDYFSESLLFVCETAGVKEKYNSVQTIFNEDIKILFEEGILFKGVDKFNLTFSEMLKKFSDMGAVYTDNFPRGSFDTPVKDLVTMGVSQSSTWEGSLQVLTDDIKPLLAKGNTVIIFAGNEKTAPTLCNDLIDEGIDSVYYPNIPSVFSEKRINIIPGGLSAGIEYPSLKVSVITYGKGKNSLLQKRKKAQKGFKAGESFHSVDELHRGDYVVHSVHGIGIFDGIIKMAAGGITKDYIKIKYAGSDVLYVPVTQLDLVSKYISPHSEDGKYVKVNRLGSKDWVKTKARVRSAVKEMAGQLVALYSKRLKIKGYAFSPDIDMQSDFERRFEFDETEDQLRCAYEIKQDMEKPYPMDRLLCGDVGFGKTEVALRAAFKCIADGKQCAILVPTTILAFQHYRTVIKRLEGFPVNVEMLSRYRTQKQQTKILKDLQRGNIDIIVGTHRLISSDVKFRDIGLVIVDEEQRFGVAQKEKLKELYPNVDVLTMSATPIPRTLNMAMTGIRDMSVIEEAPGDRLPIQSYVIEYDDGIIAEAIEKELRRGGQVYYLYNRIEDIEEKAAKIKSLVPSANIATAHGKMNEEEMSEVWQQLLEGDIDVLVCTTIIETGVDVPNCNTLIIENADRMGLAQLHQIRGRVGRSSRRASAYFTFTRGKQLSEIAQRRLDAIREFTEFGSGFKIAMRDLEIRGAGNILGAQQHGHMEAVGYDMYLRLLSEAVTELENGKDSDASEHREKVKKSLSEKECLIDIQLDAHIPERYIENISHRLGIYRRIAEIKTDADAEDVIDELIDRFGEPPESVKGLISISLLRNIASNYGIYEISQKGDSLLLYVKDINMEDVSRLAGSMRGRIMVSATNKPYITVKKGIKQEPLDCLKEAFNVLNDKSNN